MTSMPLSRRALLKGGAAVGAGLVVGFRLPLGAAAQQSGVFAPNQWLSIDRDGQVTIVNSVPEMGQGTSTSMPMIVADELDVDLSKVKVQQAPAHPKLYANPVTGAQSYGGSRGIRDHLATWRKAGAAARQMLRKAAADEWGVPEDQVDTEPGVVLHRPSGRRMLYGQLVDKASKLPVPQDPKLKTKDQFRYIGKEFARMDLPAKTDGKAIYGYDVKVPGMLIASVERPPVVAGARVKGFDAIAARQVTGVRDVVQVSHGVAVVATSTWAALKGRKALKVEWDEGPLANVSSAQISQEYAALARQPGLEARKVGNVEQALGAAGGKTLEAVYEVPFLEHACMEPMNCTAQITADGVTLWVPTQSPGGHQALAAKLAGVAPEKVTVHTTMLGGGFGRRGEPDFVTDAVETAKAVKAPVKVVWTREDDLQHGFYRPATYNQLRAWLDSQGQAAAWFHRIVGPGILAQRGRTKPGAVDGTAVAGAADLPYDIPNLQVEWKEKDFGVPVGFWRSVGSERRSVTGRSWSWPLRRRTGAPRCRPAARAASRWRSRTAPTPPTSPRSR
jgi:isoquinoline 1-oxidoreductase beta subunit